MKQNSVVARVVVGVDGSSASDVALRWTIEAAQERDAKIDVIHAWQEPPAVTPAGDVAAHDLVPMMSQAAERCLETAIHRAVPEGFANHRIHMRPWVVHGQAGRCWSKRPETLISWSWVLGVLVLSGGSCLAR